MAITAALVKELRDKSGAGMMDCKKALAENDLSYEEIELGSNGLSYSSLAAVTGRGTTPQVYIEGEHIGGADDLEKFLNKECRTLQKRQPKIGWLTTLN